MLSFLSMVETSSLLCWHSLHIIYAQGMKFYQVSSASIALCIVSLPLVDIMCYFLQNCSYPFVSCFFLYAHAEGESFYVEYDISFIFSLQILVLSSNTKKWEIEITFSNP